MSAEHNFFYKRNSLVNNSFNEIFIFGGKEQ